jgi:HK97 family phage portal protein
MSWLKNLLQPKEKTDLRSSDTNLSSDVSWWRDFFVRTGSMSTFSMSSSESALAISTVWACVRVLSESIASLSLNVYQEDNDGNIVPVRNHPIQDIIHNRPSPLYNSFTFIETMMIHANLTGNFLAIKKYNAQGRIVELEIKDPNFFTMYYKDNRLWYNLYSFQYSDATIQTLPADDVIHVPVMAFDGLMGKSPIQVCRQTFEEAGNQVSHSNNFYKNGTHLSGMVSYDGTLDEKAMMAMKKSWDAKYKGTEKTGEVAFLGNSAKFIPISISQKDADFVLSRKLSKEDIATIFRVPMHMINAMERATHGNVEQMSIDFVMNTLRPWVRRIEKEFNEKLFLDREKQQGLFVRFNIDSLMRGDTAARVQLYKDLFGIGVLSQNDIRKMESMNPIEGGDKYFVPLNMIDVNNLEQTEIVEP